MRLFKLKLNKNLIAYEPMSMRWYLFLLTYVKIVEHQALLASYFFTHSRCVYCKNLMTKLAENSSSWPSKKKWSRLPPKI